MIFKRAVAKLRAQDWMAISVELAIVIVGVFIGQQVSNWNSARIDRAKTDQMVRDLRPELRTQAENYRMVIAYYAVTRHYGETAFAGWRHDPSVSDRDFVIAAYQSSQILLSGVNSASWSQIFGSDRLRDLDNPRLREPLATLMTADLAPFEKDLSTEYRRDVRMLIPEDVQDAIRSQCGDRRNGLGFVSLPQTCRLQLNEERFTTTARALRANPKLAAELRYHFAITASYVEVIRSLGVAAAAARQQIDQQ